MQASAHSDGMTEGRVVFSKYLDQRAPTVRSPQKQELSIALYRLLAHGTPVLPERLGEGSGISGQEAMRLLSDASPAATVLDEQGAIVAFGGLSLVSTRHRFVTQEAGLFTWCVFDALFLPEILGTSATLITRCLGSGVELTVELTPDGVREAPSSDCVMSIVAPDSEACCTDLRKAFCDHVNLFRDEQAFRVWSRGRRGIGCVAIQEAQHFARRRNALLYPDAGLGAEA